MAWWNSGSFGVLVISWFIMVWVWDMVVAPIRFIGG